jgi:hypothetical protein
MKRKPKFTIGQFKKHFVMKLVLTPASGPAPPIWFQSSKSLRKMSYSQWLGQTFLAMGGRDPCKHHHQIGKFDDFHLYQQKKMYKCQDKPTKEKHSSQSPKEVLYQASMLA